MKNESTHVLKVVNEVTPTGKRYVSRTKKQIETLTSTKTDLALLAYILLLLLQLLLMLFMMILTNITRFE
jgi:hypothetical protein